MKMPWGKPRFGRRESRERPLARTLTHTYSLEAKVSLASQVRCGLTFLAVVPVLMEPVPVSAAAQVAPGRVDTLVLAPAVVLGTLVLVCGERQALRAIPLHLGAPLKGSLHQGGSPIAQGWAGAASAGWSLVLPCAEFPVLLKHLNKSLCPLILLPAPTRSSLKGRLILRIVLGAIIQVTAVN